MIVGVDLQREHSSYVQNILECATVDLQTVESGSLLPFSRINSPRLRADAAAPLHLSGTPMRAGAEGARCERVRTNTQ